MANKSNKNLILVLNCGSSSIKFAVFDATCNPLDRKPIWNGKVQGIGGPEPDFGATGIPPYKVQLNPDKPYRSGLAIIKEQVLRHFGSGTICAIGHRVVHGGSKYFAPVLVNHEVLADLQSYIPLAPLHQPFALEAISILLEQMPDLPQVACFDTCFHKTVSTVEQMLPLPFDAWQRGIKRYGFHGLSYDFMAVALPERYGELASGKLIVAHLGSGASLCAMHELKSVATTMGFSALDGLMMGTRTGSIDPGAILYLMEIEQLSLKEVADILYHKSGLLGVSGISSEPRKIVLHEDDDGLVGEQARLALDLYVQRIVREIGALVAVLGGLDMLVFTAGVGEHNAFIRERVCKKLGFLGVQLDLQANDKNAATISRADSKVVLGVEPTNEEWIVAQNTADLV